VRVVCILALAVMNPHACVVDAHTHGRQFLTSFELGDQGGVIVPVAVNGRGPLRFLLDTGSTHSAVSEAVAGDLGAPVVARAVVGSAAGGDERSVIRIDRLQHSVLTVSNILASVVDLAGIDRSGTIDGIIGQDVLASLHYTIDFRHRTVLWWPDASDVRRGAAFVLEPSAGRFLVALPQPNTVLRLVPDSGASALLLFEEGGEGLPVTILPERAELRTLTARTTVRHARLRELHVGGTMLRDVAAVVVGRHESIAPDTDGLLPLHLFERVTFDGPRRLLILERAA
jgi:predicted aspartyl protease